MQKNLDHGQEYLWCCDARADGGFMPQALDTEPGGDPPPRLRGNNGGTRMMKLGPVRQRDVMPDTVPGGGATTAQKLLYSRRDRPWAGTAKGKDFGYRSGNSLPQDDDYGRMKSVQSPMRDRALPPTLPPMRTGKVRAPMVAYPHLPDDVNGKDAGALVASASRTGLNMKIGKPTGCFDNNPYAGPQMVSDANPRAPRAPQPIAKMRTNTRKRDTFGAYPEYISDPYKDDPLADDRGRWAKGKRGIYTQVVRVKPTMPVVNVWDAPAGLQTKGAVRTGTNVVTKERNTYLSDKGRLGTTL
eukprot:NODE_2548_length_1172_cov_62.523598_g2329_i0.p1 GENE.NODE_2548_length_1172_cov_62.523598_g2329_i0~~NODE_2548_length_1172_cov_62.523598_g2329_i0.p1  ORF type:complete len:300 (+),score=33.96 NODE_2548_length_1172_cov_62.523598_g2329_i0:157-1056(+)